MFCELFNADTEDRKLTTTMREPGYVADTTASQRSADVSRLNEVGRNASEARHRIGVLLSRISPGELLDALFAYLLKTWEASQVEGQETVRDGVAAAEQAYVRVHTAAGAELLRTLDGQPRILARVARRVARRRGGKPRE